MSSCQHILKAFLKNPARTGAIFPSGQQLCRAMVNCEQIKEAQTVIELGPGTGRMTGHILNVLPPEADFISVEKDSCLYSRLIQDFPSVPFVNDGAENLSRIMENICLLL